MQRSFLLFTLIEAFLLMCVLAFFYSLNPANRSASLMAFFVLVYGISVAMANLLVNLFNKGVVWKQIGALQKAGRVALAAVITDAVFYGVYSIVHGLTGLRMASQATPSSIAIVAGIGLGWIALYATIISSTKAERAREK